MELLSLGTGRIELLSGKVTRRAGRTSFSFVIVARRQFIGLCFSSIQVAPIGADADFHDQGHGEFVHAFHFFFDEGFQRFALFCRGFK